MKNRSRKKTSATRNAIARAYHVVPNGKRWDVERDHAFTGSFAYEVHTAIGLAATQAQRDVHNGLNATVCVEEQDGTYSRKIGSFAAF
jgi:hypothetical protein